MRIAIGSDHGGFKLKKEILDFLSGKGHQIIDFGTDTDTCSSDYPDYALLVCEAVTSGKSEKGIVICGTGLGISMAANKVRGIRAALCTDSYMARMSREHNDANILALGGRVIGPGLALDIVEIWLSTAFSGELRHANRVNKIMKMEQML
ncbi:MAG: ribose 5-phosphate isomerase B [Clostridiales bacterium]|nr:ribose 5-phosphate isomerase B [Clostridiales bacterium]